MLSGWARPSEPGGGNGASAVCRGPGSGASQFHIVSHAARLAAARTISKVQRKPLGGPLMAAECMSAGPAATIARRDSVMVPKFLVFAIRFARQPTDERHEANAAKSFRDELVPFASDAQELLVTSLAANGDHENAAVDEAPHQ